MEADPPTPTHAKFRIDCQLEDVKSVWLKLHNLGQHELYDRIRQLEEWAETLDSREEKQHKRLEELSVLGEDPVASYLRARGHKVGDMHQEPIVAEKDTTEASNEAHANEELREFEPPKKKSSTSSSSSKKSKLAPQDSWIIRNKPSESEEAPQNDVSKPTE